MTTIVVGGHSRNTGKTSVAAALISALAEYAWTAIKISPHWHDGPPAASGASVKESSFEIIEESNRQGRSDTSRFLAAGAARSLWVRAREGHLAAAIQTLLPIIRSNPFVIIESNSILRFIRPDLFIIVIRFDLEDFKDSAREMLRHAHAVVVVNSNPSKPIWKGVSREALAGIPLFATADPQILPVGLLDLVRSKLPSKKW
jgi:molybdopterin-guanine dinucleotide biosynthesis protein